MEIYPVSFRKAAEYMSTHREEILSIEEREPEMGQPIVYLHSSWRKIYKDFPKRDIVGLRCRLSISQYGNPFARKDDIGYWMPANRSMTDERFLMTCQ